MSPEKSSSALLRPRHLPSTQNTHGRYERKHTLRVTNSLSLSSLPSHILSVFLGWSVLMMVAPPLSIIVRTVGLARNNRDYLKTLLQLIQTQDDT